MPRDDHGQVSRHQTAQRMKPDNPAHNSPPYVENSLSSSLMSRFAPCRPMAHDRMLATEPETSLMND